MQVLQDALVPTSIYHRFYNTEQHGHESLFFIVHVWLPCVQHVYFKAAYHGHVDLLQALDAYHPVYTYYNEIGDQIALNLEIVDDRLLTTTIHVACRLVLPQVVDYLLMQHNAFWRANIPLIQHYFQKVVLQTLPVGSIRQNESPVDYATRQRFYATFFASKVVLGVRILQVFHHYFAISPDLLADSLVLSVSYLEVSMVKALLDMGAHPFLCPTNVLANAISSKGNGRFSAEDEQNGLSLSSSNTNHYNSYFVLATRIITLLLDRSTIIKELVAFVPQIEEDDESEEEKTQRRIVSGMYYPFIQALMAGRANLAQTLLSIGVDSEQIYILFRHFTTIIHQCPKTQNIVSVWIEARRLFSDPQAKFISIADTQILLMILDLGSRFYHTSSTITIQENAIHLLSRQQQQQQQQQPPPQPPLLSLPMVERFFSMNDDNEGNSIHVNIDWPLFFKHAKVEQLLLLVGYKEQIGYENWKQILNAVPNTETMSLILRNYGFDVLFLRWIFEKWAFSKHYEYVFIFLRLFPSHTLSNVQLHMVKETIIFLLDHLFQFYDSNNCILDDQPMSSIQNLTKQKRSIVHNEQEEEEEEETKAPTVVWYRLQVVICGLLDTYCDSIFEETSLLEPFSTTWSRVFSTTFCQWYDLPCAHTSVSHTVSKQQRELWKQQKRDYISVQKQGNENTDDSQTRLDPSTSSSRRRRRRLWDVDDDDDSYENELLLYALQQQQQPQQQSFHHNRRRRLIIKTSNTKTSPSTFNNKSVSKPIPDFVLEARVLLHAFLIKNTNVNTDDAISTTEITL